jgi:iron complex transport system ATP-binding protein
MLEVIGVSCGYDNRTVLFDIHFRLERGEMVGIIGPNGSGKTTLLRLMARTILPAKGTIYWQRRELDSLSAREWARKTAVVSQSPPLCDIPVEAFVLLGRIPYLGRLQMRETAQDRQAVRKALELTGLTDMKERYLSRMSGGERQMALIARALAQEPELLLMDEPTTHLDLSHQIEIMDLVGRLNEEGGLTVVLVLHDLNLASEYCRRLLFLNEGRIQADGPPEEVLTEEILGRAYPVPLQVERNPFSGKPHVLIVPRKGSAVLNEGGRLGLRAQGTIGH